MPLTTHWRNVKNKEALKILEDGSNDSGLGLTLCVLEVPVIHEDTIEELEFGHNFYKSLTGSKTQIDFKMFIGYSCNSGFLSRVSWIKRIVKANTNPSIASKRVWECYYEVRKDN